MRSEMEWMQLAPYVAYRLAHCHGLRGRVPLLRRARPARRRPDRTRQAGEKLRQSEERFRQFGDASSDVLWIRDAETLQWKYLSPAFEAVCGDGGFMMN